MKQLGSPIAFIVGGRDSTRPETKITELQHRERERGRLRVWQIGTWDETAVRIKSAQNAGLGPSGASLGKISLFHTADVEMVVVASYHRQFGKTVRFL